MATARTRRSGQMPENLALAALQWLWAALLLLIFVAAGLTLAGTGVFLVVVGLGAALNPNEAADVIGGTLFAVFGVALVAAAGAVFWLLPRAVLKLSGRAPGPILNWIAVAALSLFYYTASTGLVGFGGAFVWNSLGSGSFSDFDHPVAGVIMLVSGIVVFVFFPRLAKRLTGHEVLSSPYAASGAGGGFGGGGCGGSGGGGGGGNC